MYLLLSLLTASSPPPCPSTQYQAVLVSLLSWNTELFQILKYIKLTKLAISSFAKKCHHLVPSPQMYEKKYSYKFLFLQLQIQLTMSVWVTFFNSVWVSFCVYIYFILMIRNTSSSDHQL